jgi:hypothetical protein
MAPVLALVIALHAALLAVPLRSARPQAAASAFIPLQVRMLGPDPAEPMTAVATAPAPAAESMTTVAATPAPAVEAVALQAPPAAPATIAEEQPPVTVRAEAPSPPPDVSPPQPLFGLVVPGADSDGDYFPRGMLTLAPAALDVVVIDYPPIPDDRGHHVGELTLFIDETGRVVRVRVDDDALPAALGAAAKAAFLNARFRAGEADGRAVKSRIRIEVVFDSQPIDSARAQAL